MKQTIRDAVTGELSLEYFARRFQEGWRMASIEWVRDLGETHVPAPSSSLLGENTTMPYGFQLTEDGQVQESPLEAAVLLLILDQVVKERRIQEIAAELNQRGFSTRAGSPWSPVEVFNLMPRLIDAGPSILKSAAWLQRPQTAQSIVEKPN